MNEIKDFPGYFITEDGRVYSARKQTNNGKGKGFKTYFDYNDLKELKQVKNNRGYFVVSLYKNKIRSVKTVHSLVAETYIENPNNLPHINHIDEVKTNNHISNLEWVTPMQNVVHSNCRWIWKIENIITGEIIETINLSEFSKSNNLNYSNLHKTLMGKITHYKNHKIISKTQYK